MPRLNDGPAIVKAAGSSPKQIEEYAGRVSTGHEAVSAARRFSPQGRRDPGEWVRYSGPRLGGAGYVAGCIPAFDPETVNRDPD